MPEKLTLEDVKQAVAGNAAAFRCITEYQPVGGPGDKVFPPTYEGGRYAMEERKIKGEIVPCVLLDGVASQANRMELALLEAYRAGRVELPLMRARFDQEGLQKKFTVTSLEAPHRAADAIFRDSLLDGVMFRKSEKGRTLDNMDEGNATALFGLCPTALVFGMWDSAGPRGGLGAKFRRRLQSEIIGWDAHQGVKTSSRLDPLQLVLDAGPLYERAIKAKDQPEWTLDEEKATQEKKQPKKLGKDGKPSEANHGNVTPGITSGGFTISKATQTIVLSLTALRRLRFPLDGEIESRIEVDQAARIVLATLGLAGAVLMQEEGADLRSRCQLIPVEEFVWHLLDIPGKAPKAYDLDGETAVHLFKAAVVDAKDKGLPWEKEITFTPSAEFLKLLRRSQELLMHLTPEEG